VPLHPYIAAALAAGADLPAIDTLPITAARAQVKARYPMAAAPHHVGSVSDITLPGGDCDIRARVYRPSGAGTFGIVVFFHGSGFVVLDLDTHDEICRHICAGAGCVVVSVDYRLAPEHPYPAPLDDCWTALRWAAVHASEIGGDASRIAVGGDSAGGNLAAVCALLARDAGGPALALQALVYPVADVDFGTASYIANGDGYLLDLDQMQWFFDCYTTGHVDPADWHVSPLRAPDLSGVAPAVVITAEYDPLRDEGKAYADRLRDAGVAVEYRCFEGMIHSFFGLAAYDAARDAMELVGTELRRAFGTLDP